MSQEKEPGSHGSQEARRFPWSQEEPGGARRSQEERGAREARSP